MQGTDEIDSVAAPFCSARTSFCFTTLHLPTSASDGEILLLDTTLPISPPKLASKAKKIDSSPSLFLASARAFVKGCDKDEWGVCFLLITLMLINQSMTFWLVRRD